MTPNNFSYWESIIRKIVVNNTATRQEPELKTAVLGTAQIAKTILMRPGLGAHENYEMLGSCCILEHLQCARIESDISKTRDTYSF